jgi:hypothetical protein
LSITTDGTLQQEKAANMTIESDHRWGQLEFLSGAIYAGWWRFNPDLLSISFGTSASSSATNSPAVEGASQISDDLYGGDLIPAVQFDGKGVYAFFGMNTAAKHLVMRQGHSLTSFVVQVLNTKASLSTARSTAKAS